jgi:hypothetical protein
MVYPIELAFWPQQLRLSPWPPPSQGTGLAPQA